MNSIVLAVDDNKVVVGSTARMLGSLGYAAIPAETDGEALAMVASRPDLMKGQCDG
jgi:CheY-like chemotaxis protein